MRLKAAGRASVAALCLAAAPSLALAHEGHRHLTVGQVALWWTFDPLVVAGLLVSATLYGLGLARLWRKGGVGAGISRLQALSFALGWLTLLIALVSPVHALGEVLFSAHMIQHMLLMLVAAPLVVFGRPVSAFVWGIPLRARAPARRVTRSRSFRSVWEKLTSPLVAFLAQAVVLCAWHVPALYQATLTSDTVHALQHTSFLAAACLFWFAMIYGRYGRMAYGLSVLYVFATTIYSGVLGALVTFAPRLWYPIYAARTSRWDLSPLQDQQLAGLWMWVPSSVIFIVLGLALFSLWLTEADRRVGYREGEDRKHRAGRRRRFEIVSVLALAALFFASACQRSEASKAAALTGGDPDRGRQVIPAYGCESCHTIPGVPGAHGQVGPSLEKIGDRVYVAGHLQNTPDNMIAWIRNPQRMHFQTAMPQMGVTLRDARDIAAYLYSLK